MPACMTYLDQHVDEPLLLQQARLQLTTRTWGGHHTTTTSSRAGDKKRSEVHGRLQEGAEMTTI